MQNVLQNKKKNLRINRKNRNTILNVKIERDVRYKYSQIIG